MAIECARARAPSPHGAVGQPQAEDMADADDPREKLKQIIANWIRCTPIRLSPYRPQGDRGGPWSRLAHLERTSCFHRGSTRSAFALGHAKNSSHSCRRNIALPPPKPRGGRRALAGERSEPVRLAVRNRHRRSLCGKSPAQSEQWYCWIGRRRIISASAENRGNSCQRKHPAEILALGPSCASHRRSSNANSLCGRNSAGSPEIYATFQRDILRHVSSPAPSVTIDFKDLSRTLR